MTDYSFVPPSSTTPKVDPAELPKWLIQEDDDNSAGSTFGVMLLGGTKE